MNPRLANIFPQTVALLGRMVPEGSEAAPLKAAGMAEAAAPAGMAEAAAAAAAVAAAVRIPMVITPETVAAAATAGAEEMAEMGQPELHPSVR